MLVIEQAYEADGTQPFVIECCECPRDTLGPRAETCLSFQTREMQGEHRSNGKHDSEFDLYIGMSRDERGQAAMRHGRRPG